jgi:sugar phosphate permease
MLISPLMGYLVDRLGERVTMPIGYLGLAICCALFAVIGDAWVLAGLWLLIKLLQTLGMGLSTYVRRLAPAEEMTPTLSAGVSINHISSVLMPMLFGVIQPLVGFGGLFMLTAGILLASVPFARAMQVQPPQGVAAAAGE